MMLELVSDLLAGIFQIPVLVMVWLGRHVNLFLSLIWFMVVGKVTLWIIAKMLWPVAKPLSTVPSKPLTPPNGMSKEAWISKELAKLPDVIREAEIQAEEDWRKEHGESDPEPKPEAESNSFKTKHECINCHSPFWTSSGVEVFWPEERRDEQLKEALSDKWSGDGQSVAFEVGKQRKVTACDPPRLAVRVQRAPHIFHEVIVERPHPLLDRIDIVSELGPDVEYVCIHKGIPGIGPVAPYNYVGGTIAAIRVGAGATSILDTDITILKTGRIVKGECNECGAICPKWEGSLHQCIDI
jgi:hypothetical protein